MDCGKVGLVIQKLRQEKGMTQSVLANELNISNKTVSKWERGAGCPDITLIPEISEILGVDIAQMLKGDLVSNDFVGGNMKNSKFYVCPSCGNLSVCTGNAEVSCCGRKLEEQEIKKAEKSEKLKVEVEGDELYITSDHPMQKDNYISFAVFAVGGGMNLVKLYPEWDMNLRFPRMGHGKLIWYSTTKGLFYQLF